MRASSVRVITFYLPQTASLRNQKRTTRIKALAKDRGTHDATAAVAFYLFVFALFFFSFSLLLPFKGKLKTLLELEQTVKFVDTLKVMGLKFYFDLIRGVSK